MVVTKGGDGAVGGHQEWQHVEPLGALVTRDPGRARAGEGLDVGGDGGAVPRPAVHQSRRKGTEPRSGLVPSRSLATSPCPVCLVR